MKESSRPLKNVSEATEKCGLWVINEHPESVSNTVAVTQIILTAC